MGKTILITMMHIEKTEAFRKLSKVAKKIVQNKTTINHIQHGVNVSKNIGFEKWQAQTAFNSVNSTIVKELSELKKE